MRNRGIGRARMFMGALLLLAAVLTWGIGLTMSPHGESVARGTDYLRSTILTFKRNGAIGTLILCALAAWLLFPRRRPKWPARDWSLTLVVALLAASSIYTLISLQRFGPHIASADENLATTAESDASPRVAAPDMNAPDINPGEALQANRPPALKSSTSVSTQATRHPVERETDTLKATDVAAPAEADNETGPPGEPPEQQSNSTDDNQTS